MTTLPLKKWELEVPVVIFRKCITRDPSKTKKFQLDLIDPLDGICEYQVIATNQELSAGNVMDFYNGRCGMEREIAELKTEYGFANLVTNQTPKKKRSLSRTTSFRYESLKSLRFKVIARADRIVNIAGKYILKMARETKVELSYRNIEASIDRIAA